MVPLLWRIQNKGLGNALSDIPVTTSTVPPCSVDVVRETFTVGCVATDADVIAVPRVGVPRPVITVAPVPSVDKFPVAADILAPMVTFDAVIGAPKLGAVPLFPDTIKVSEASSTVNLQEEAVPEFVTFGI